MTHLQICALVVLTTLAACSAPAEHLPKATASVGSQPADQYVWTKLVDSAAWKKSYNFQMFSQHDTLWVFHPDGSWFSPNGTTWTKSPLSNVIANLAFLDYVQFKEAIYGLGHLDGNIEHYKLTPAIYRTTDFRNWQTLTRESNLPQRFFYHPFVFEDKLWIIGGEDHQTQYADIWNSTDGVVWTLQKDRLPFGQRSNSQVVQLKGRLFLLNNDVWTSSDGLNWQQLTEEIMPGEDVFGYAAVVYDEKIWLLGCNRNGQFSNQVLVSADGRQWAAQQAPWTPRGGVAAAVHGGKIYMTGGKYGGLRNQPGFAYSNDIWTLEKK